MPKIVILAGEGEYFSERTLLPYADRLRERFGAEVVVKTPDVLEDMPDFPQQSFGDLSDLADADLALVYLRWRRLPDDEMRAIVDFVERGGSVVGLRTSSHSFHYPEGSEWERWNDGFGANVLGSPWIRHHGHTSSTDVRWMTDEGHPILAGIPREFHLISWLYLADLAPGSEVILWGDPIDAEPGHPPVPSPVAWVRENGPQRVVYTNMGHPDDMEDPNVVTFLLNAVGWALEGPADTSADWTPFTA